MLIRDRKFTTVHLAREHWDQTNPWVISLCGMLVREFTEVVEVRRTEIGHGVTGCGRCQYIIGYPLTDEPLPMV